MSSALQRARRIVVKVGSSLVTNDGRGLDDDAPGALQCAAHGGEFAGVEVSVAAASKRGSGSSGTTFFSAATCW